MKLEKYKSSVFLNIKMKKVLFVTLLLLIFFPFISSETSGGDLIGKQSSCLSLPQECADCTFVNITTVTFPNMSKISIQKVMTKDGSSFSFNFCNTTAIGNYAYCTLGDVGGVNTVACNDFEISPSGKGGSANTSFYIFLILIIYTITFISFFGKNAPMTILCGMLMIFLGLYMINNGIIVYRDDLTNYFAYVTTGIGFIFAMWASSWQFDIMNDF